MLTFAFFIALYFIFGADKNQFLDIFHVLRVTNRKFGIALDHFIISGIT